MRMAVAALAATLVAGLGGSVSAVASTSSTSRLITELSWSPDGKWLAFVAETDPRGLRPGVQILHVVRVDRGVQRKVVHEQPERRPFGDQVGARLETARHPGVRPLGQQLQHMDLICERPWSAPVPRCFHGLVAELARFSRRQGQLDLHREQDYPSGAIPRGRRRRPLVSERHSHRVRCNDPTDRVRERLPALLGGHARWQQAPVGDGSILVHRADPCRPGLRTRRGSRTTKAPRSTATRTMAPSSSPPTGASRPSSSVTRQARSRGRPAVPGSRHGIV